MNKVELKYFSSFYVDKLYRQVAGSENFDSYKTKKFICEENFAKGSTEIFIDSGFSLNADNGDLENSILLYESLSGITEVQASDERFWTYLTHTYCWNYMRMRWPVEEAATPISRIRERYFLRNLSLESLTRNGLSRLWWYAHITCDVKRKNKYELLEVLLQRQDLAVGITERAIGTNKKLRTAVLEYLKENPEVALDEKRTRELIKGLSISGGVKMLPLLEINEIKNILEKIRVSFVVQN